MATQRVFVATLAGNAAPVIASIFASWRADPTCVDRTVVDRFCATLRANGASLPVVYFSEWIDRWLMGDRVPGPEAVWGVRFQTSCFSREEAIEWAARCGSQFQEEAWLAARLREAASAWSGRVEQVVVVVV